MIKNPRSFDHAVLPVESLAAARSRHEALGFTVAPEARHPFGTENCCIFFEDGTYLEPLGINQREDCEASARAGNGFTADDQAFRFRNGENGFSALAFLSEDAKADRDEFVRSEILAANNLTFSRSFEMPDGSMEEGRFELTFTRDRRAPDIMLFCCQDIHMPKAGKSVLAEHKNGVQGIAEIILSEQNPSDFQYYLQNVMDNRDTPSSSLGMEIAAANVNINVLTPEGLRMQFGVEREACDRGLRLEGIVFDGGCPPEDSLLRSHGRYAIADRKPGQGAFYAFTDTP